MNIYILIILLVIFYIQTSKENISIKKGLYNSKIMKFINQIDKKINKMSEKYNLIKMHEFSIKLSNNYVSNERYSYGIGATDESKVNIHNILDELCEELEINNNLVEKIKNYLTNNKNTEILSFGASKETNNNANKIYLEINNKNNYDVTLVSYESIRNDIYTRYYTYKFIGDFLYAELKKYDKFYKIFNKYFPIHKIKKEGYKYSTTKNVNMLAFRIYCLEYNTINDIQSFIYEMSDYFNLNYDNLIKVKKWINSFKYNELNIIGISFYPNESITLYTNEITQFY